NIITDSGERLSFFKLISEKNYRVEIPIIQRDYAQGRESNTDIRDSFLAALKEYLKEEKPNRDLDFIYGSLLNGDGNDSLRFVPLDGQQRLTTLFLLHWYLAVKEDKLEPFRKHFTISSEDGNSKSKFTYETRTSAREFCNALVSASVSFRNFSPSEGKKTETPLADALTNQQWYFQSWSNDPTIQGMLVMLDAIHLRFKAEKKEYYELLTNSENPVITFQFLKLEEFGLTDDLYIKMNARGKPLTSFENFKAKFEQQIKHPDYNKRIYVLNSESYERELPAHEYFSHKIDTTWANLFWAYLKDELQLAEISTKEDNIVPFDDLVMNLFKTFAINYVAGKTDSESSVRDLIKTRSAELSFNQFKGHKCFNPQSVPSLIDLLDILENGDNKAKQFIPGFYYFDENLLEKFLHNDFKTAVYSERIFIHAYFQYLTRWSTDSLFDDLEGLKNWIRVIHNLTVNSGPYNNEREFTNSIKGINAILEHSNNIHQYLINENTISGFDPSQFMEEILKANLIEKSNSWKELIYKAEQHGYLNGQIGFLLRLADIAEYYDEHANLDWDEASDEIFKARFLNYFEKTEKIFSRNGLKEKYGKAGNYIWERALLSIGDFLIWEGRNQSFLINSDRDISWKRLLKGDKNSTHPGIIKTMFDALDINLVKESLENLIENFDGEEWKKAFIETPELFNYLGQKRYVRPNSPQGYVLLKGERMSGAHVELFTYRLYLESFRGKQFSPFKIVRYDEITGDADYWPPHIKISDWGNTTYSIQIRHNDSGFRIRFNISQTGNSDILNILEENGMKFTGYDILGYEIAKTSAAVTVEFVEILCTKLKSMTL
ncbi:MAG: DUF262 domain-containing protein, partial [Ignavibacteria bacterium]|nr:DUF262 domain-containing protein [Ignavibacteria bacterium]